MPDPKLDPGADRLRERCADPGWTPGVRDVAPLLAQFERSPDRAIVRALARGEAGVVERLLEGFAQASPAERALRLQVLTRMSQRHPLPALDATITAALADPEPRVVREAARAVGKAGGIDGAAHEPALLALAEHAAAPERRAAVEALGRVGSERALELLRRLAWPDEDLARRAGEAIALIERRSARARPGGVVLDRPLPQPLTILLRCRSGAARVVAEQAATLLARGDAAAPKLRGPDAVALRWAGDLGTLYRVRSMLDVAIELRLQRGKELGARIVESLRDPDVVAALQAWTHGPPRFRLAFTGGGHRRALVWNVARALAEAGSPLINDTRDVSWTIEVDEREGGRLLASPRGADPRFLWRTGDVPAASHPSLAALLAWEAAPQAGELVWDPFCGSGAELVECAKLAPGLHLRGSDRDPRAIEVARANLEAAHVEAASTKLWVADVTQVGLDDAGSRPSLILCNPPMGRRVEASGPLADDLGAFVEHAARLLAPGGRLVWLSPLPKATAEVARRLGLAVREREQIDMRGFSATLQVLRKGA